MRVGIILYPGSNCAEDMKRYFESFHDTCFYIWHKEDNINILNATKLAMDRAIENLKSKYKNNKIEIGSSQIKIQC